MRRLPGLEIVASFGVGYDHVDARWAGERGIIVTHTPGVLDDEVADVAMALTIMAVRQLPQAERYLRAGKWLNASFPLTGVVARPDDGHSRARTDRQGGRPARRGVRAHGRLSQPPRPVRRSLPALRVADRDGRGLRHPHDHGARRPRDPAYREWRGPQRPRAGRRAGQHRPRLAGRRAGADRGASEQHNPGCRPRRVRERTEGSGRAHRARQRGAAAACRLGLGQDAPRHGPVRPRQSSRLVGGQAAAQSRAGDAVARRVGSGRGNRRGAVSSDRGDSPAGQDRPDRRRRRRDEGGMGPPRRLQ